MAKLTDTQLVILSAAAQRDDGKVYPLPKSLKAKRGAHTRTLQTLLKKNLLKEERATRDEEAWRETENGQRLTLMITDTGLQAVDGGLVAESGKRPSPDSAVAGMPSRRAKRKDRQFVSKASPLPPAPRQGTKQAILIALLTRKTGATLDEAVKATGWQPHSVRGAISGTLKKKLGLMVESSAVEGRGRVYRIVAQA